MFACGDIEHSKEERPSIFMPFPILYRTKRGKYGVINKWYWDNGDWWKGYVDKYHIEIWDYITEPL